MSYILEQTYLIGVEMRCVVELDDVIEQMLFPFLSLYLAMLLLLLLLHQWISKIWHFSISKHISLLFFTECECLLL